jgi:hypothetical protein
MASTKQEPSEYIGAVIRGPATSFDRPRGDLEGIL